jgi:hypothetical protein
MAADVRRGMPDRKLDRETFDQRFKSRFTDPISRNLDDEIDALAAVAWDAYADSRKAPLTRKAGPGFADPSFEIAIDWLNARAAIQAAQRRHDDASAKPEILLINGSRCAKRFSPTGTAT